MRRWRNDFKNSRENNIYYDLYEDWDLIESSIAQQYGIRIRKEIQTMEWAELSSYISGLNAETPLGYVVSIRSENDSEKIKKFTPEQSRIRSEWRRKIIDQVDKTEYRQAMDNIKDMFIAMCNKKKEGDKD